MMDINQFTDEEVLAKTAFGENRGGGKPGMTSVLNVIMNRATHPTWWGDNPRDVCLKPEQFDTWNTDDPNYQRIMTVSESDPAYEIALELAKEALAGTLPDITDGATYYYATSIDTPYWAKGHTPCKLIAGQCFYNDIA